MRGLFLFLCLFVLLPCIDIPGILVDTLVVVPKTFLMHDTFSIWCVHFVFSCFVAVHGSSFCLVTVHKTFLRSLPRMNYFFIGYRIIGEDGGRRGQADKNHHLGHRRAGALPNTDELLLPRSAGDHAW